jgi:L1 cell adhesion molecule like protein
MILPHFSLVFDFLRDVNGKQITDTVSLSRARFEELCAKEFKMIIGPVETAINNAKMDKSQIHDIVLVGGSIRIPKVQMLLSECFPRKKITILAEAVAYGAAVQAAILSGKKSETINVC